MMHPQSQPVMPTETVMAMEMATVTETAEMQHFCRALTSGIR